MENEESKLQETPQEFPADNTRRTRVGFPQVREEKRGKGKLIFIVLAILALVAVGVWLIFGRGNEEENDFVDVTPTRFEQSSSPTPTFVEIERDEIKIQVLNGTGVSGAAGDLKSDMETLGYSQITVGNADNQNYENTEVNFSDDVAQDVKDEIISKLESVYQEVDIKAGSVGEYDVRIITGYKKGYTPTTTPKPTTTSTPTPTGNLTPTLTTTPTPTP